MYALVFRCHREDTFLTSLISIFFSRFPCSGGAVSLAMRSLESLFGWSRGHRHSSHVLHVASPARYTLSILTTFSTSRPLTRALDSGSEPLSVIPYPTCWTSRVGSANLFNVLGNPGTSPIYKLALPGLMAPSGVSR